MSNTPELVTLTIDGKQVQVPKGTNLIEAARHAGVEVPHYCYHKHLSVAGNCRMCQVHVQGQPKLTIACNTGAAEGMVVQTQESSKEVSEAQRACLEFLLINHPLDCTVCDQAGHCKLQDYYYEYNGKPSRFIEEKVHKVKAEPLGPDIIYDGERCILCTRCVRFCDEVTGTSELGVFNRGDHSVIGISGGRELNNPLAGSVVDLCPVGALTHRRWRFNTRIWYTDEVDTVCTGCSTGCNAKVHTRDGEVVHVKARLNSAVNQEWMCDEGRYGFGRFQPSERLAEPLIGGEVVSWKGALEAAAKSAGGESALFLSPFLTLEEIWLARRFAERVMGGAQVVPCVTTRSLSSVEAILISPDYAPNARAFTLLGLGSDSAEWRASLAEEFRAGIEGVRSGKVRRAIFVGDLEMLSSEFDESFFAAVSKLEASVAITPRALSAQNGAVHRYTKVVLPTRTVHEKSGVMVNRDGRLQRLKPLFPPAVGALPEWLILNRIATTLGKTVTDAVDDRGVFRQMVSEEARFRGLSLMKVGEWGVTLDELQAEQLHGGAEKGVVSEEVRG